MIDIYTEKSDSKDWIFHNDLYFNLNTGNEEMSQKEIDLIQQVDAAKLTPDKHIETKYGSCADENRPAHQRDTYQAAYHAGRTGNGFRCKPLDRCEHREGQIGIAAVVHQRTPLARSAGEPRATDTGNPGQPDRTQETAREETLPCTPFKTR